MKWCRSCGEYKPPEGFPLNARHKDGRASICKPCHSQRVAQSGRRRGGFHLARHAAHERARRILTRRTRHPELERLIEKIYLHAAELRRRGRQVQVDHIVPLKHPLVCGLHVPHNLTVSLEDDNRRKGNRFWPEMPEHVLR